MKQIFEHYEKWEDFQHGMYDPPNAADAEYLECLSFELLSNIERFSVACSGVIENWQVATAVNLTNKNCNRRAWLGQAACCFVHGVPEVLTRAAWKSLSNEQRLEANEIAGGMIDEYERSCEELRKDMGGQRLF